MEYTLIERLLDREALMLFRKIKADVMSPKDLTVLDGMINKIELENKVEACIKKVIR